MAITPNMGMTLPTPTVTPGPLYATENNQAFTVIDAHDHTPGNGVSIPSNGININGDLAFNSYNASLLRSSQYVSQSTPLTLPADLRSIYSVNGDLYYNNGIGQPIQITAGAALNATSIGGIGGDYATSTASVFYTSADETFTFWSASNTTASIEAGPLTIRNNNLNSFGVTINADPTISANYALFLPPALPVSGTKFLTVDASGNIADMYDVDNSTIEVSSNVIQVKAQGITNVQIANDTILDGNIANGTITTAKLASGFLKNAGTYQIFDISGTLTIPADVTYIRVVACGGGGGGQGGFNASPGPSRGGAGGYGAVVFEGAVAVIPGELLTLTVGAGGGGSINGPSPSPGSIGTSSIITGSITGAILTTPGGAGGGAAQVGSGHWGGAGTDFATPGVTYTQNTSPAGSFGSGSPNFGNFGGSGGGSIGSGGLGGTGGAGGNATGFGGGGGGGTGAANDFGGTGGPGRIIIYIP